MAESLENSVVEMAKAAFTLLTEIENAVPPGTATGPESPIGRALKRYTETVRDVVALAQER